MAGTNNSWNNQITGSYNQIILNAGTNGVAISTDASAATVNVATGGAVKTTTLGSTNSTSATTVQSGTGALNVTATNGALTINSGTGGLGVSTDASATTVSFATGAAVKTVTLGSTNSTSSTAIKSGTGNVAINTGLTIDSTGRNYNTVQPAFLAVNTTSPTNVTGDGTEYTLVYDTEFKDQGNNFDGTSTFTAPITGIYQFNFSVQISDASVANTLGQIRLITTARSYAFGALNVGSVIFSNLYGWHGSIFTDMTAGDTAITTVRVFGSTKIIDIQGFDGSNYPTTFSGFLVC